MISLRNYATRIESNVVEAANHNRIPADFGRLARRISIWTTNGLFSALIVVVGLGFGRQVVRWWHAPSSGDGASQLPYLQPGHSSLDPRNVAFGNLEWSLDRQMVAATRDTIRLAAVRLCEQCVSRASCPEGACGPAETRLMRTLAECQPTASEPGQWLVYETMNVLPMAVGLRVVPERAETGASPDPQTSRISAWCVAVPAEEDFWTVLCFSPASSAEAPSGLSMEIPRPDGSRVLLSVKARQGGSTEVFSGSGELADWEAFFVGWFAENGWEFSGPHPQREGTWHGRYSNPDEASPYLVDIQLTTCEDSMLAGVLVASPAASPATAHDTSEKTR